MVVRQASLADQGFSRGREFVRWVQSTLNQVLNLKLAVNGIMNAQTRSAIRQFQRRQQLPEDGLVGPDTERALLEARRAPASAHAEQEIVEYAGEPMSGEISRRSRAYVRWVQQSLNKLLGLGLAEDGIMGRNTRDAIRAFQRRQGLQPDGVVGSLTESALIRAGASSPPSAPTVPAGSIAPAGAAPWTAQRVEALKQNMLRLASEEWKRWGRSTITESEPRIQPVLRKYWEEGVKKRYPGPARAWSAAFISWVMREAGAGSAFRYSSGHVYYVAAAKRNRLRNDDNPFKAYRISEIKPQIGDIVCAERMNKDRTWSGVTYDNVDDGRFRASHCDIVVDIKNGRLITTGGNVGHSVSRKPTARLDANGFIRSSQRYFAVIRIQPTG